MSEDREEIEIGGYGKTLEENLSDSYDAFEKGFYNDAKKYLDTLEYNIEETKNIQERAFYEFKQLQYDIEKKEEKGYDVEKAEEFLDEAKQEILKMEYDEAFNHLEDGWDALKRSLFIPFPLLEKNVTLRTTLDPSRGRVRLTFDIINRMEYPLGEIIINFLTPKGIQNPPERALGFVKEKETKTIQTFLNFKEEREETEIAELLLEEKIKMTSQLDCSSKYPEYAVTIENRSGEPLRDIKIKPFIPEALKSTEEEKTIEWLEPSAIATVTFQLFPKAIGIEEFKREMREETISEDEIQEEVKEEDEFLKEGSNYLLESEDLHHSYSIFSQYFSKQGDTLVVSTTIPYKISQVFGVEIPRDELIWLTNIESNLFQVISPKKIHEELMDEIETFIKFGEEGVIFIDKLERMKMENGFESTLEFLEEVWNLASESEFTLLVHVNPEAFSEDELKNLKEKLRLYQVD